LFVLITLSGIVVYRKYDTIWGIISGIVGVISFILTIGSFFGINYKKVKDFIKK
jgi:hypothetical protein